MIQPSPSLLKFLDDGGPLTEVRLVMSVDIYGIVETLFRVQGFCLFELGFVNGDQHPGNVMLLDSGEVGLVDWGQVKRYSEQQRARIAAVVAAVARRDEVAMADGMAAGGVRTREGLPWTRKKMAEVYFGSFAYADELGGMMVFEENLQALDKVEDPSKEFIMAVRNIMLTRTVKSSFFFFSNISTDDCG